MFAGSFITLLFLDGLRGLFCSQMLTNKSRRQMIGRGMRLYPGKHNCHVIDMVASLKVGIVNTPTLFGLDPSELVNEANIEHMRSLKERNQLEPTRVEQAADRNGIAVMSSKKSQRLITFTDYDSVYDLIDDTSGERHIRGISQLAWVCVGQNRYILSSQGGSYITIESSNAASTADFSVIYTQKVPERYVSTEAKGKSPYMRPRIIAESGTLSDAVHAADTFALKIFPRQFVHHGQAWRRQPATEGQLAFINKLRPMSEQLSAQMCSKGKATDMICKIKFGAKGWFNKLDAARKRGERAGEKIRQVEELRQRERVRIGPLNTCS